MTADRSTAAFFTVLDDLFTLWTKEFIEPPRCFEYRIDPYRPHPTATSRKRCKFNNMRLLAASKRNL